MCGICGIYHFKGGQRAEPATVQAMARSISHRGPDDEGFHFDGPLGLGFRRLSIIDLSLAGHQPMSDLAETVWVAFNGEIYNFQALRRELESRGHVFRSNSDTEVIVHGYKEWGTGVLSRLAGMFGLAIWDVRAKKLVVARDSTGIKLIYYRIDRGTLSFGSELRAVLAAQPQRPAVDTTAMNLFLRYRYTPSPLTMYDGVHKLAPGSMLVVENGEVRVERWYEHRPQRIESISDAEASETLLGLYKQAMERHLIADVPVGLLLSGGIDSGLLLGLMNLYGKSWPTYTVGYGKSAFKDDELTDAAETARLFGANHHEVELSRDTFERALPKIVSILEEPIAASSIVPMFYVCERARQDVTVALVGQGPDELFAGYTRHLGVQYGGQWRRLPGWLRRAVGAGIGQLPRNEALKRGVYSLAVDEPLQRYRNVFSLLPGDEVDGLFRGGSLVAGAGDRIVDFWDDLKPEMEGADELGAFQVLEVRSSLPDELMMYADKISMAHGLEVRVPFLDKDVVEFAQRLPAAFKVRWGQRKWLHRRVCEQFLPKEILARKKRGFAVNVVDQWFEGSMNSKLSSYLLDGTSRMFEFLEPRAVSRLLDEHRSGRRDNHKMLFSLVVLEEWLRANAGALERHEGADLGRAAAAALG
jgi:asparagine synthase (glutamine-hydrolysing)